MCKMSFTEDRGYILLVAVTCFLIPLIVMFYCYLRVFLKVRFHKKQVQRWNSSQETEINFRRETKTARVVFTVLFVFVGCWTPFVTVHILQASLSISLSRAVFHCVTLVAGLHSACNPIIYITMNRTFRNDFLDMCPCKRSGSVTNCGRQNRVHPLNTETSLTLRSWRAKWCNAVTLFKGVNETLWSQAKRNLTFSAARSNRRVMHNTCGKWLWWFVTQYWNAPMKRNIAVVLSIPRLVYVPSKIGVITQGCELNCKLRTER